MKSFYNTTLRIYDSFGSEIRTLVDEAQTNGNYKVKFDANDLASGVYFARLNINGYYRVIKILLMK